MYQIGSLVEMKKPHACTIKATGKKANELILKIIQMFGIS